MGPTAQAADQQLQQGSGQEGRSRGLTAPHHLRARELLTAQESERRRIARELHDEIGQSLTALKINLQIAARSASGMLPALLDDSIRLVEQTLDQVRNLSLNLHPSMLDEFGLVPALRWYLERIKTQTGLQVSQSFSLEERRFQTEIEVAGFRIVQEAVTNALRHAQCRSVTVEVRLDGPVLHALVRDDGIGFDPAEARRRAIGGASLGLVGMQERAEFVGGQLTISSETGRGTHVHAEFPVDARPDAACASYPPPNIQSGFNTTPDAETDKSSKSIGVQP